MKKVVIGLIAMVMVGGKMDAQSTQKFTASKSNDYGLVYNLPITVLDIEIEGITQITTATTMAMKMPMVGRNILLKYSLPPTLMLKVGSRDSADACLTV